MGMRWPSSETSLLLQQTCEAYLYLFSLSVPSAVPGTSISSDFLGFCCPNQLASWSFYPPQAVGFQHSLVCWVSYLSSICLLASQMWWRLSRAVIFFSFFCPYGFRSFFKNPVTVILAGALGETVEVRECAQSFHGSLEVIYPFFSFNKCWGAPAIGTVSCIS